MATKKKSPASVTIAPEKPVRLKKDGSPWGTPSPRASAAELVKRYTEKRDRMIAARDKSIAKYDRLIEKFSAAGVNGDEAARELLADGYTEAEIVALEAKFRKAKAALKAGVVVIEAPVVDDTEDEDEEE